MKYWAFWQDAHDAEILSLSFVFLTKKNKGSEKVAKSRYFLASGGRDRMIHLYDVERNFDLIESIDDHYVAVTSVKVTCNGSKIISCSADRSLIFLDVNIMDTGCKVSRCHHQKASHGTVYDMALDPMMEAVITVGQVLNLNFCHHGFNSSMKNLYVPCLIVVSSKDEQPVNKFVDLFNTDQLPSILKDGAMDPKIPKQYMLVHDNQDGTSEKASKILTEMKSTFGANDCRLLCIISSQDSLVENQDNPLASHKTDASLCQQLGCFLNIDDISEIKDIMQDLSSKDIIPYMEQKIRVLNQQVSATRKGFKNQIKYLWRRKGKEETVDTPNGPMYTFSSVESQIRVLGDYAFMLRDYELALSNYRLISTDYKLDKSWKRYAGVQDKKINTFSIAAGKLIKSFKPDGNFGDPIKVAMDPSCSYLLYLTAST